LGTREGKGLSLANERKKLHWEKLCFNPFRVGNPI